MAVQKPRTALAHGQDPSLESMARLVLPDLTPKRQLIWKNTPREVRVRRKQFGYFPAGCAVVEDDGPDNAEPDAFEEAAPLLLPLLEEAAVTGAPKPLTAAV